MADTVEEVYVWTGTAWQPVVRDATVEKTSELTNDGEDGVNPFITAADIPAVPDKTLPIDSADGTVTLDSPAANTFTVSTSGSESFRIAANGDATFQSHVGVMSPSFSTVSLALQGEVKPINAGGACGVWVSADYVVNPDATYDKHGRAFASVKAPANGQAFDTFTQFYASAVCGNAVQQNFGVYASALGAVNNYGCVVTRGGAVQDGNYGFYSNTGYPNYFDGQIQCNTLTSQAAAVGDATITLGADLTLDAGGGSAFIKSNKFSHGAELWVYGNIVRQKSAVNASKTQVMLQADELNVETYNYGSTWASPTGWNIGAGGCYVSYKTGGLAADAIGRLLYVAKNTADNSQNAGIKVDADSKTVAFAVDGVDRFCAKENDILAADGYTPLNPQSLATKAYVDGRMWKGTQAQYDALGTYDDTILYLITS